MGRTYMIFAAAVAVLALAFAAPVFADQSSISGYNPDDTVGDTLGEEEASPVGGSEDGGGGGPVEEGQANSGVGDDDNGIAGLPFTGLDLGLIVGAGGVLALLGLGLRRLTSTPSRAV